ncbi:MAG TPA: magnesium transporter [Vicinamibacterales bacterium]|nr:magnesium transporter [Vicinamibacterales bacterium]
MAESTTARLDELALQHAHQSFAVLRPDQRVDEALVSIRAQQLDSAIVYFYVVDAQRQLLGVVPTRRLLTAASTERVSSIMTDASITLPLDATLRDAAATLVAHRLLAVPLVGPFNRIHGVIDASALDADISAEITGRRRNELFQLIGVRLADPGRRFRSRMSALTWNIVGGLIAASVAAAFDDLLRAVVALTLFMPVTLALSESIGMQAVALSLEALHGQPHRRGLAAVRDEVAVAFPLALVSGTIVALAAVAWRQQWLFAVSVLVALGVAMTIAATFGALVPRLLHRVGWNPTVAAGPAVLALADFVSLIAYFTVAAALLGR